jgi:heparan-sulfate lyase
VDKSYFVLVDEGIGEATGDLHLNFNLCENKDNVVLDAEQKGAHTSFADNNNIVIRTFAEDNNSITCQEKEGRFSFSSSANDGYKERIAYSIDMNKADNKTARFATVILPIEKYTEEKERFLEKKIKS